MGMGFQFKQHRLGLWDLSWDLKKTISWEMGLGPPLHDPREGLISYSISILLQRYNIGCSFVFSSSCSFIYICFCFSQILRIYRVVKIKRKKETKVYKKAAGGS